MKKKEVTTARDVFPAIAALMERRGGVLKHCGGIKEERMVILLTAL